MAGAGSSRSTQLHSSYLSGGSCVVSSCTGTALAGITPADNRWDFHKTQGIAETRADGLVSLSGNATETVISGSGTPTLALGTWVCQSESQFTCTAAGRLTYSGELVQSFPFDCTFTVLMASGGDKQVMVYLAKNGTIITETGSQVTASSSKAGSGGCIWQDQFSATDYIEVWVENVSDAVNVIVNGTMRVN